MKIPFITKEKQEVLESIRENGVLVPIIIRKIENSAPVETAEAWDCVGFMVETKRENVFRIMVCLTVTDAVVAQARRQECDMIISHHPLFEVPISWSDIDIYSAHTNLDKAQGGTTDTIIDVLYLDDYKLRIEHEFLRMIDFGQMEFENSI